MGMLAALAVDAADLGAADQAFRAGDYAKARQLLLPLADTGDSSAQYKLAVMYDQGLGLEQDFLQAKKWYQRAAESGNIAAQYNLAILYYNGQGVQRDLAQAYAWLDVALNNGYEQARIPREHIARELSADELKRGDALAQKYRALAADPEDTKSSLPARRP